MEIPKAEIEKFESFREKVNLGENKKELNVKEIAKIIFESFKFSQGNIYLQFLYLLSAYNYYGPQSFEDKEVKEEFLVYFGLTDSIDNKMKTGLSRKNMHAEKSIYNFIEMTKIGPGSDYSPSALADFLKVLKDGRASFARQDGRTLTRVSLSQKDLSFENFYKKMTAVEFQYLVLPEFASTKVGRPNRIEEAVGNNTLRDRFYSFLVWNILLGNKSGSNFSDLLFSKLKENFVDWFNSLEPHKPASYKYSAFGGGLRIKDYIGVVDENTITKDNILELISTYNYHHANTMLTEEMLKKWGCKF